MMHKGFERVEDLGRLKALKYEITLKHTTVTFSLRTIQVLAVHAESSVFVGVGWWTRRAFTSSTF